MAELADEELHDVSPKSNKPVIQEWEDIGYYTDEYGRKRYGVIPKNNTFKTNVNNDWTSYDSFTRTSNPRYR